MKVKEMEELAMDRKKWRDFVAALVAGSHDQRKYE